MFKQGKCVTKVKVKLFHIVINCTNFQENIRWYIKELLEKNIQGDMLCLIGLPISFGVLCSFSNHVKYL